MNLRKLKYKYKTIVRAIKRRAQNHPNEPPATILASEVEKINNEEFLCKMPRRNDVIRNINRIQNRHRPVNTNTLEDLIIEYLIPGQKTGTYFTNMTQLMRIPMTRSAL